MTNPLPALPPAPALFDVTTVDANGPEGMIARVPLDRLELAPNARRAISDEGIARLAAMLMRTGQLVPCIGRRPDPATTRTVIYDGQRRLLAARASERLAGSDGFEQLAPVRSLMVLLLDHAPTDEEIRRIQAQANRAEELALCDQQEQFRDCWRARAGLPEEDRVAAVCADLGISAKKAHSLRRQLMLPDPIRVRVAERPSGEQISVTLATKLADMHEIAPELTRAVAQRITTTELHDCALRDLGAFVHRTVVEDEHAYAVRIDDGALLDGPDQIEHARGHLDTGGQRQAASLLGCALEQLDTELDTLAARAKTKAFKLRIDGDLRDRARAGRYAYVHDRGRDFAAGMWVIDPVFMLDVVREQLEDAGDAPAREHAYFSGARLDDDQLRALKAIVCHLLAAQHRDVIAFGAGWTDTDRQQPVGDTGRREPRQIDAIVDAELQRALDDPDPLRGIAHLVARFAAAFVLDPGGATRTKTLGTERMARKLHATLPGGESPLRAAVWEFLRPMLSPRLAALNRDAFVIDDSPATTVDLAAHRRDSGLAEIDLDDEFDAA